MVGILGGGGRGGEYINLYGCYYGEICSLVMTEVVREWMCRC